MAELARQLFNACVQQRTPAPDVAAAAAAPRTTNAIAALARAVDVAFSPLFTSLEAAAVTRSCSLNYVFVSGACTLTRASDANDIHL